MRRSLILLAGLSLSATTPGCGGATIPEAPPAAAAKEGPPPGSSPDMTKVTEAESGSMGPARPSAKKR